MSLLADSQGSGEAAGRSLHLLEDDFSGYVLPPAAAAAATALPAIEAATPPARVFPRLGFAGTVSILTALAIAAIGIYFWLQLRPVAPLLKPAAAMPAAPATTALSGVAAAAAQEVPADDERKNTAAAALVSFGGEKAAPEARSERPTAPGPATAGAKTPRQEELTAPPAAALTISRTTPGIDPRLAAAYEDYLSGRLEAAHASYEEVLAQEPKNLDALHGVAAINLRQGRPDQAAAYFLRALEAHPKDALAQAGLLGLQTQVDPTRAESMLKSLAAEQPQLPFAHFSLGNLYARQARWAEAEQAYFRAVAADPGNPDLLFNLAVSLDRLRQAKPARQYYLQAQSAALHRAASFDAAALRSRLSELAK